MNFDISGDKELLKLLEDIPKKEIKKAMRTAFRKSAKVMAIDAQALTPQETGLEQSQIKVRAGKRSRKYDAAVNVELQSLDPEQYYFSFDQLGHKTRSGSKVEGNESLGKAFDKNVWQQQDEIMIDIMEAITKRATNGQ